MKRNQHKQEIVDAALQGIRDYLGSTRGAQMFRGSRAIVVPGTYIIQVSFRRLGESKLSFFELPIKESVT